MRSKFNRALNTAASFHDNTHVLELKKGWDMRDSSLFLKEESRYTSTGLTTYWEAVDKTVKYTDTILFKKLEKREKQQKADNKETKSPAYAVLTPISPGMTDTTGQKPRRSKEKTISVVKIVFNVHVV